MWGYAKPTQIPVHAAGARPDPPRDGHALWAVSGLANGLFLRTWHSGLHRGEPKIPKAIQTMIDCGLIEIRCNPMGRQAAFFTEAGLEALRLLLRDRRAMDLERFAHLRHKLGL